MSQPDIAMRRSHLLAVGMLGKALVDRLAQTDGRVGDRVEDRLDRVVVGDHAPVGGRILLGEFGEFVAGPVNVVVLRQIGAVRKRKVHHDLRMDVFESVVARARARRCAASGCPGSRHGPFRTSRAGSPEASIPPSRNCRPPPACPPAPGSGSRPWPDRRRRSGCCARHPRRRHQIDQAYPLPPFQKQTQQFLLQDGLPPWTR